MYKNQLQELAQRSCFNLPSYSCLREGPDHAPRFKATVNFHGELFESPFYCSTLRQAEHAAAEVALNTILSRRGPTQSLAARILDETGICKNLLQETAQRAGVPLPFYTTTRSGPGHMPVFTCVVELAGLKFYGEAAKTKKQAEKNAAMTAWSKCKQYAKKSSAAALLPWSDEMTEDQEQSVIAKALALFFENTAASSSSSRPSSTLHSATPYNRDSGMDLGRGYSSQITRNTQNYAAAAAVAAAAAASSSHQVRIRNVNLRNNVHEVMVPHDEHQRDEDEWLRPKERQPSTTTRGPTTAEEGCRQRQPIFYSLTPSKEWALSDSSILAGLNTTRCTLQSPAPPVRVRSVVPVCAAPPERPQPPSVVRDAATAREMTRDGNRDPESSNVEDYLNRLSLG